MNKGYIDTKYGLLPLSSLRYERIEGEIANGKSVEESWYLLSDGELVKREQTIFVEGFDAKGIAKL